MCKNCEKAAPALSRVIGILVAALNEQDIDAADIADLLKADGLCKKCYHITPGECVCEKKSSSGKRKRTEEKAESDSSNSNDTSDSSEPSSKKPAIAATE